VQAAAGRTAEAVASHQPALALARPLGNRRAEAQILGHLVVALARLGQHGAARLHVQQGLAILRAGSDLLSLGLMLCGVAECEALDGQPDAAAAALSEARALAAKSQAGHASELGLALARLQTMLPLASRGAGLGRDYASWIRRSACGG
jgi:hypothetical protein